VGPESAFILLQRWHAHRRGGERAGSSIPVYVQGGVGLNTAAACLAAGAARGVLAAQLLLARESPLGECARSRLAAFGGSETTCVGERLGVPYRIFSRPGWPAAEELAREEERIAASGLSADEKREAWRQTVRTLVGPGERDLRLVGQDA